MKRTLSAFLLVIVICGFAVLTTGAREGDGAPEYKVKLDNSFGLIEGADVKVAGVRAGTITDLTLDRSDMRAVVAIKINQTGFGDLRTDVFCETKPQSLIGEYFLDCQPGKASTRLERGATIPVERTGSTVPVDLVNNIYRRPIRERFSIIVSELGAALAARGGDLNETIRRASPALRETDRVLKILADQRRIIRDLYQYADEVVLRLADNRKDVTRFISEARDTAATSATRADGIRAQFRAFPTFLRELRPTIKLLGQTADRQRPALENLNESAEFLTSFFRTLGPFARASRPAFRSLASAGRTGRGAIKAFRPQVVELRKFSADLPEVATNLAITLEHLNDPAFATEKDERAGRGKDGGHTGFEALLRYIYAQTQAVNLFDENSFMLKVDPFVDKDCAFYADAAKGRDESIKRCRAWLGPNQPGVTTPDPSPVKATTRAKRAGKGPEGSLTLPGEPAPALSSTPVPVPELTTEPARAPERSPGSRGAIGGIGGIDLPRIPLPGLGGANGDLDLRTAGRALDYLLGP